MRSYDAARSLFSFLGFIAWAVVVTGVIVALIGAAGASKYGGGGAGLLAMVPGIGIGITGFILVAFVQMGRATVDTAEYTQQMLKLSRDQLEISRQGLKAQTEGPKTFGAVRQKETAQESKSSFANRLDNTPPSERDGSAPKPERPTAESTIYKRKLIRGEQDKYIVGEIPFETLLAAKEYVDSFAGTPMKSVSEAYKKN